MNETLRFSARHAAAIGLAALATVIFRPSQPFLATLTTFLLLAHPFGFGGIAGRVTAAWSGVGAGIVLVSLFPQQPWLLFPAFAGAIILAIRLMARSKNPAILLLVAMGICAALPAGLVYPRAALHAGWDHGWDLTIGVLAAAASFGLFPPEPTPSATPQNPPAFSIHTALLVAITAVVASWVAVITVPGSSIVLVIAAATTALGASQPNQPSHLGQKTVGALIGSALAVLFDILVAGADNSVSVFLIALMAVFAGLAFCMRRWNSKAPCFTQCCAMFSVAAPMLPAPDTSLAAMGTRIAAVLLGFGSGAVLCCLGRLHFSEFTEISLSEKSDSLS